MKRKAKGCLCAIAVLVASVAIAICILKVVLLYGPLSQASLLLRNEEENLAAIAAANLPMATDVPIQRANYPTNWIPVPGFKSPILTRKWILSSWLQNGPLEGQPVEVTGIIYKDMVVLCTHKWVGGRDWGLVYSTNDSTLSAPYWSKKITRHWHAWYGDGNTPPKESGQWYE